MTSTVITVDREAFEHSFREWQADQTALDNQLAESLAALDAYQSNLDSWQQELVRERDALREMRSAIEQNHANGEAQGRQIEQLHQDLNELRQEKSLLEAQLEISRARENELTTQIATQQDSFGAERQQWEQTARQLRENVCETADSIPTLLQTESLSTADSKSDSHPAANPVLGSVMEQFGKLRKQRSLNRPSPKPR